MAYKLSMKLVSSLEKCFLDELVEDKAERNSYVMFANERLSFQLAMRNNEQDELQIPFCHYTLSGSLAPYVQVREVVNIPSIYPVHRINQDEHYLRNTPGLYPDLLRPMQYANRFRLPTGQLRALWFDIELPEGFEAGDYSLTVTIHAQKQENIGSKTLSVHVVNAALPHQKLIHTEWFYTDCIAEAYHVPVFSEKHWKAIESFMRTAVRNGINMLLTPVFTPELDTYVGGERLTTQLVKITVREDGGYDFDFSLLGRWIALCRKVGVEYLEIPHFFTQWGAKHAPKFVAKVKGRTKKIFGWETDAMGEEYRTFLSLFIPALVAYLKEQNIDRKCFFHISDEPNLSQLEHYTACKNMIAPYLGDYPIIDALSNYQFYETGALKKPVPCIDHIMPFWENQIEGLWAYYCGAGGKKVSTDRFFAMPTYRTRILGVQLYRYNIEGFLHWGYNFYHNQFSYDYVDPFGISDGDGFAPSGDAYLVYPGENGQAWESLRLNAMREAMDDIRALELCESVLGREKTEALIQEGLDAELTFFDYPHNSDYLLDLRERIALAIEENL